MARIGQAIDSKSALDGRYVNVSGDTMTGNLAFTDAGINNPTHVQFDTTITPLTNAEGLVQWNATDGTLDLGMSGGDITMQIGQEMFMKVRNVSGATIPNGSPVYASGRTGNRPNIYLARSDAESTSNVIGITTQDIASPADGFVTTVGYVRQIKTNYSGSGDWGTTWVEGDKLYVSKTVAGQLTNVEPAAPHHSDIVGTVEVVGGLGIGSILVNVQKHKTLDELTDVDGGAPDATGDLLTWNQSTLTWERNAYNITDYTKPTTRYIVVDPSLTAATGKIYNTIKAACDYVATQSPSSSANWLIKVSPATYNELAFTVPDYTRVEGMSAIKETGTTTSGYSIVFDGTTTTGFLISLGTFSSLVGFTIRQSAVTQTGDLAIIGTATANVSNISNLYLVSKAPTGGYRYDTIKLTGATGCALYINNCDIQITASSSSGSMIYCTNAAIFQARNCWFTPNSGLPAIIENTSSGTSTIFFCRFGTSSGSTATYDISTSAGTIYCNNSPTLKISGTVTFYDRYYNTQSGVREAVLATDIPLTVKGATSQSANLQEWQNSSGTRLTSIDSRGFIGIGIDATSLRPINQVLTYTTTANNETWIGEYVDNRFTVAHTGFTGYGLYFYARNDSGTPSKITGVAGEAINLSGTPTFVYGGQFQTSSSTTATNLVSLYAQTIASTTSASAPVGAELIASRSSTTTGNAFGLTALVQTTGSGVMTSGYGLYVKSGAASGGAITNLYGLYLENQSGGSTLNYSIYSAGGANLLNAGAATVVPLTVKGAGSQSANLTEWQNSSGTILASISSAGALSISSGTSTPVALTTTGTTFQTWTKGSEVLTLQQTTISDQFFHFLSTDRLLFSGTNGETVFGDVTTDATTKQGRFSSLAYNSATQPAVSMLFSNNTSTANSLNIGGGTNINQAVTAIRFHTTPAIETVTGTLAGTIDGSGYWCLGSQATGLAKLHLDVATGDPGMILRTTGGAPTAVTADITGIGLMAGNTVNATNKYTSALKFGSTDTSFTTTNPKYGAIIVGYATENYTADTDSGMGIEFFTTPNDAGATPTPISRGRLDQNGLLTLDGSTTTSQLTLSFTDSGNVNAYALLNNQYWTPTADSATFHYAMYNRNYFRNTNTTAQTGGIAGLRNEVYWDQGGGTLSTITGNLSTMTVSSALVATLTNFVGSSSQIFTSGGAHTITNSYGYWGLGLGSATTGTITTHAHFYGQPITTSGGATITNAYGLYLGSVSVGSTLNYAIFTNSGLNELNDQLFVNGSADRIQLIVQANATQTTNLTEWQNSSSTILDYVTASGILGAQSYEAYYGGATPGFTTVFKYFVPTGDALSNANFVIGGGSTGAALTTGTNNFLMGVSTGVLLSTGGANVAIGSDAFRTATDTLNCTAIGRSAMRNSTGASNSTAIGYSTATNITGVENIALGNNALGVTAISGAANIAIGFNALYNISDATANANVAIGHTVGRQSSGAANVWIGYSAARNATASNSVVIGYKAGLIDATTSYLVNNDLVIHNDLSATSKPFIRGNFGTKYLTVRGNQTNVNEATAEKIHDWQNSSEVSVAYVQKNGDIHSNDIYGGGENLTDMYPEQSRSARLDNSPLLTVGLFAPSIKKVGDVFIDCN